MELLRILANSSIDDVEKMCQKFGINIKSDNGDYKTIDTVFNELSNVCRAFKR